MEERTKFHMCRDVHKDSISVGAAESGRAPARERVRPYSQPAPKLNKRTSTSCPLRGSLPLTDRILGRPLPAWKVLPRHHSSRSSR